MQILFSDLCSALIGSFVQTISNKKHSLPSHSLDLPWFLLLPDTYHCLTLHDTLLFICWLCLLHWNTSSLRPGTSLLLVFWHKSHSISMCWVLNKWTTALSPSTFAGDGSREVGAGPVTTALGIVAVGTQVHVPCERQRGLTPERAVQGRSELGQISEVLISVIPGSAGVRGCRDWIGYLKKVRAWDCSY